jgi:2-amino-4-hydroxy-6-hydroxymethyldihydropteridine diphosphokinase
MQRRRLNHTVFLGLGSNLGDRDAHLAAAIHALAAIVTVECVSSVYDTAPMLYTDQPRFHNLVCQTTTTRAPAALLRAVKQIERRLGRRKGVRYGPRIIDIDLLLYDDLVRESATLMLPHPRMMERAFVLAPLAEIAPTLIHPVAGETITALLHLVDTSDIQRVGPLPHSER